MILTNLVTFARRKREKKYIGFFFESGKKSEAYNLPSWNDLAKNIFDYNWSMNQGLPSLVWRFVKISQPVSVTKSVCSNWAENLPSLVTAVHWSGHCLSFHILSKRVGFFSIIISIWKSTKKNIYPSDIIGSMVNTFPALITPTALFSEKLSKKNEVENC